MYAVVVHTDVLDDVKALAAFDPAGVGMVFRFIEKLKEDDDIVSRLLSEDFEDNVINVDSITQLKDFNIWRLKVKGLDMYFKEPDDGVDSGRWLPYRIFYAPDHKRKCFYILAVVRRRDDCYKPETERNQKLADTCRRLGFAPKSGSIH